MMASAASSVFPPLLREVAFGVDRDQGGRSAFGDSFSHAFRVPVA